MDAQLPADATITNVTVSVEWKSSAAPAGMALGAQVYVGGTARGTELTTSTPASTDTVQRFTVSGLTRADLLDGQLTVRVRATRGNGAAFTASLDAVSVDVAYTSIAAAAAPTYDANGNLTSDGSYGNRTYAYDALGRLTGATGNGHTTTYGLDGLGNRWSETTDATTTAFDLDLAASAPTILADGTRKYLPGDPGAGYDLAGVWWSGLTDRVGSPTMYVSQAGTQTPAVHYDPYGALRPGSTRGTRRRLARAGSPPPGPGYPPGPAGAPPPA